MRSPDARDLTLFVDETFRDASKRAPATLATRGDRWVTAGSLTKSFGLGVTPGSFFGDAGGVRVSLGREPKAFSGAADAWDQAVATFAEMTAKREPA